MKNRFKYNFDRRSRWISAITILLLAVAFVLIYVFDAGHYIYAWLFSIIAAVLALCSLSIPRFITVNDHALEIHCTVELTRIDIRDISVIRSVSRGEYRRRLVVALGSYGFFGYYGYYLDIRKWEFVKVYATEWNHLVEIEDIYEQRYLVSCRHSKQLIETVMQAKLVE